MKIKSVIFDLDDTLYNRSVSAYKAYKVFFRDFDLFDEGSFEYETLLQDMLLVESRGLGRADVRINEIYRKYDFGISLEEFRTRFLDWWTNESYKYIEVEEEDYRTLTDLREKYKLAILTNGIKTLQYNKIKKADFASYFDEIVVSTAFEPEIRKPDPEIYKITAERLNCRCEECIFIGDNFGTDLLGAYRANMVPVLMHKYFESVCDFDVYQISDLNQIEDIIRKIESQ